MKIFQASCLIGTVVLALSGFAFSQEQAGWNPANFRVTVTNLTRGQGFGLPLVVSHAKGVSAFELGKPASAELTLLAEEGNSHPLATSLEKARSVHQVMVGASPIPAGHSMTFEIRGAAGTGMLSVLGMLGTTNDTFGAVTHLQLPVSGKAVAYGIAYDAGTERNSEKCEFIPGPPCNHPGVRDPEGAEGYVHVSAGIHGIGDLPAAVFDWRNPVIQVSVERIR